MSAPLPDTPMRKWSQSDERMRAEGPDPVEYPQFYDGVTIKRVIAYVIDFVICTLLGLVGGVVASILGVMSFGLLFGPLIALLALIPLAYYTYFIARSPAYATWGMRFVGIRVYRLNGEGPELLQAFVQSVVFLITAPATSFLILAVCLFNSRRRCLHDIVAGTLILNDPDNLKD